MDYQRKEPKGVRGNLTGLRPVNRGGNDKIIVAILRTSTKKIHPRKYTQNMFYKTSAEFAKLQCEHFYTKPYHADSSLRKEYKTCDYYRHR